MNRSSFKNALCIIMLAILVMFAATGCGNEEGNSISVADAADATKTSSSPDGMITAVSEPAAAKKPVPLRVEIIAEGAPERLPNYIMVAFNKPILPEKSVGAEAGVGTEVGISPPVEGKWYIDNQFTLLFKPKKMLPFETDFQVELQKVETADGIIKAPKPNAWKTRFSTPAFQVRDAVVERINKDKNVVDVALLFSGPVSVKSVLARTSVRMDRKDADSFEMFGRPNSESVLLRIKHAKLKDVINLTVNVRKGVKAEGAKVYTKQAYSKKLELRKPNNLKISGVYLNEGPNGYYFDVVCNDYSEDYYWNKCDVPIENVERMVTVLPESNAQFIPQQRGFRIVGDFQQAEYRVIFESGLKSSNGAVLTETYAQKIKVPRRSPKVSFGSKGRYLPRERLTSVPVKHINLTEIDITVRRIPEQNIVYWLSSDSEIADDRISDVIAEKKIELASEEDVEITSWLDLSKVIPEDTKGVFEFRVDGPNNSDSIRLVLTDLTMIAKRYGKKGQDLMVWVLDSEKLTPVNGAVVELMTMSNRVLAKAVTNGQGLAEFKDVADPIGGRPEAPYAVIARAGKDLTAIRFSDLEIDLSEYKIHGAPYESDSPYRAAIYMDRGVYRPGETAHLVNIVWEKGDRAPARSVPVMGLLLDPKGKELERVNGETNSAGMVAFDFNFQDYAATGRYGFYLQIGKEDIGKHRFLVEEFVPERMKVKVSSEKKDVLMTEAASFDIDARYLFGATARGERMEAECILEQGDFSLDKYPGYTFDVWRKRDMQPVPVGGMEGTLDDEGKATVQCRPVSEVTVFKGPGRLTMSVNVFEAGSGRTTMSKASVSVHPADYYIGLMGSDKEVSSGRELDIDGIVVDWEGNLRSDVKNVKVELFDVQADWIWEYDSDTDRSTWRTYLRETPMGEETVTVKNGKFKYSFTPAGYSSGYLIRVTSGRNVQTDLYVRSSSSYWWEYGEYGQDADRTPKPSAPTGLIVEAPDTIKVGDSAKVGIKLPYPGRLLLTLETDHVIESKWYNVEGDKFETTVKVRDFAPNVYVSALLIKDPFYESDKAFIPGRAFGVKSVKISPEQHEMKVTLSHPAEVMPNEDLVIDVKAEPVKEPLYATVWAVDEGILQLTNYQTPNPLDTMFEKRRLAVKTYETVGWTLLLPSMFDEKSAGGGDGPADEKAMMEEPSDVPGRVHAIKPVALWSGVVALNSNGEGSVRFRVPTYRGELRIVAVVAGSSRIGSTNSSVKVRDPIVLQPTFPRFLMAHDVAVIPVFLTNTTTAKQEVKVVLSAGGNVEFMDASEKDISLEPGQAGTVTFLCRAIGTYGAAAVNVEARAGKLVSRDSVTIPLIPNSPVVNEVSVNKLEPGDNNLAPVLEGWLPQYEQTTVTVLPNKYAGQMGHLRYLIRYPYGCIEQTTSTSRPLLYITSLVGSIDPEIVKDGSVEEKFMHGVNRLFSMQTYDGGFSYWPGESAPTYWGTAYVTHLLLDGIEAGYPIPRSRVDDAIEFMERTLNSDPGRVDPKYGYSVAASEPYMQFVLAKAGKPRTARIRKLIKDKNKDWGYLEDENMFLLKAALYLSGDRSYEKELKNAPRMVTNKRTNGWTFWSALRTRGMMLNILEDLFPGSPDIEPLAQSIADNLNNASGWYTTQELSWCVSGLGKRAAGGASDWSEPTLMLAGKTVDPLPRKKNDAKFTTWSMSGASGGQELTLNVKEIEGGALYALVQVEGVKPGVPYETGDNFLKVTRRYRNANGEDTTLSNIKLGDVVYVELTLANLSDDLVRNVALVDRFAAGFDIENPRLNREHAANWIDADNLWNAGYVNMRDDRIEMFGHLKPRQQVTAIYVIRAVIGGNFTTPPVRAEAMYDPVRFSQHTGEPVRILDPWQAL